jgi:tRNA1Val (adenine37-N6)-methyltransferase
MENKEEKCLTFSTLKIDLEKENQLFSKSLSNNTLLIEQPEKGYRFSIDALMLAHHVNPERNQRILDLGTGCGIISLIIARRFPHLKIYGIEIQEPMAQLAHFNVFQNKLEGQITIICADIKCLCSKDIEGPVDMIVVNPPFGKFGHSRFGQDMAKTGAKHEIFATLSDIIKFSSGVLKDSGILLMIYPSQRLAELFYTLQIAHLEPKWLRTVHPGHQTEANRVIVKAIKNGRGGITIGSPLYVYGPNGSYTPEIEKMFKV